MLPVTRESFPVSPAVRPTTTQRLRLVHSSAGLSRPSISQWELFKLFLKAGLAFGGGLGILAIVERELVEERKLVDREDFLTMYGLARLLPVGTMSAVAVAYGHRLGGWLGTVSALSGLLLPGTVLTLMLTALYEAFRTGHGVQLLAATVLPGAVAFIVAAAVRIGKEIFKPSPELGIALCAFVATLVFNVHPSLVLLVGGTAGLVVCRKK